MRAKLLLLMGLMCLTGCGSAVERLDYGKEAFVVIYDQQGDGYELGGTIPVRGGKTDAFVPGAVVVVAKEGGVELKSKHYEYRSILLIDSKTRFIVAPPGYKVSLPADLELFGHKHRQGEFTIPSDSKMPK
jgi:hypothetical protein